MAAMAVVCTTNRVHLPLKNLDFTIDNPSTKLLSGLYAQRRTGKFCDVKIRVGSTCLWAHTCVLSTFSAKLHNLFVTRSEEHSTKIKRPKQKLYGNWSLNAPLEINITELQGSDDSDDIFDCVDCADQVIDFLYKGSIKSVKDLQHADHIENFGKILSIPELFNFRQQVRIDEPKQGESASAETPDEPDIADLDSNIPKPAQYPSSGRSYYCLGCGSAHRSAASLLKHLQEAGQECQNLTCSLCLKYTAPDKSTMTDHLQLHDHALPFFCLACDARFRTRTALASHEPRHSTETPFLCGECGRGFKWKHALRSHTLVHSAEKRHLCDTCGFSTAHISTFRTHKMVHAGVCFRCPQPNCKFVASRKQSLAHHIATHSKERHYQCEVCGQSFSMFKNLRRHAARHEPSPSGLVCCPVPGCLYANTRLDKIKAHAERHRSGKTVRTLLVPRVRRTNPGSLNKRGVHVLKHHSDNSFPIESLPTDAALSSDVPMACVGPSTVVVQENVSDLTLRDDIVIIIPPDNIRFTVS